MNHKDLKIVVICGGISSEREVSLRSGKAVWEALQKGGYTNAYLFDLKRDNLKELLSVSADLAFLALHGKGGEDGCIQGFLELAGIPYTGSSVETSAICMNKIRTKEILLQADLPTPHFVMVRRDEAYDARKVADRLLREIGLPMVLKAPCEGSSFGVVIVKEDQDIISAMEAVFAFGDCLMAEEFVDGVEVTLPILGNDIPMTLPMIEITSENEFYDYEAKYKE